MDAPTKFTENEAYALLEQGKRVCLNENEHDYWVVLGPQDDPCLTEPTLFHHEADGQLRREVLRKPKARHIDMYKEKYCEDLDERITYNNYLKEHPEEKPEGGEPI